MNVAEESSRSPWMEVVPEVDAPMLTRDGAGDVVVIGAGMAGLSLAYELASHGSQIIVIDRGAIGSGMTARTTAHLALALDDGFAELIAVRGEEEAALYHSSQVAAINRIERICLDERIDADFRRVDGYLFAPDDEGRKALEREYEACRKIGAEVEWVDRAPVPGRDSGRALRFPRQARFHPTRYLSGLAAAIARRGGLFHGHTAYVKDREEGGQVVIETEGGSRLRARAAVFATNSPVNNRVTLHTKQTPMRTYAIAGRVPAGSVADALVWDTLEAYHYVRLQPLDDGQDLLIVGGEDHRSGEADDSAARFGRLEAWIRAHYPDFTQVDYRWSGQVLEPIDFMPFAGRNPGHANIYVHTGDSGQGITNAVAGALTLYPLLAGETSRYASLFDPGRKSLTARPSLEEFVSGQLGVAKNLAEYLMPGEIKSVEELAPGQGALLREGLRMLAVYRAPDGSVSRKLAACTHIGCIVHWNELEKCWDCPCHGSQFAPKGDVLNGPATRPLADID